MIQLLIAIILSAASAQIIDFSIVSFKTKQFKLSRLWQTGGFPSSHAAGVSSLATGILILEGFNTSFIIALALAAIVCRDAIGVRLEVGKHSKLLNQKFKTKLNEKAGHTLTEVAGGIVLGIIISLIIL